MSKQLSVLDFVFGFKDEILEHLDHEIVFKTYKPGYRNPFATQPVYHDVCVECKTCDQILWSFETWKDIVSDCD